jgi:hypothetical protein
LAKTSSKPYSAINAIIVCVTVVTLDEDVRKSDACIVGVNDAECKVHDACRSAKKSFRPKPE